MLTDKKTFNLLETMEQLTKKAFIEQAKSINYFIGTQHKKDNIDLLEKTKTDLYILESNGIEYHMAQGRELLEIKSNALVFILDREHIDSDKHNTKSRLYFAT